MSARVPRQLQFPDFSNLPCSVRVNTHKHTCAYMSCVLLCAHCLLADGGTQRTCSFCWLSVSVSVVLATSPSQTNGVLLSSFLTWKTASDQAPFTRHGITNTEWPTARAWDGRAQILASSLTFPHVSFLVFPRHPHLFDFLLTGFPLGLNPPMDSMYVLTGSRYCAQCMADTGSRLWLGPGCTVPA